MRFVATALLVGILASQFCAAEEDDFVMGNYAGGFSSAEWQGKSLRVEVVALGNKTYRAVFHVAQENEKARVEIRGKVSEDAVKLEGEADLGAALGGTCVLSASIAGERMTGTITNKQGSGAFKLGRIFIEPPTLGATPPEGAVALMDGTNLDAWTRWPEKWCLQEDGSVEVCGSNLVTRQEFGDGLLHVEFMNPFRSEERGQGRGNSGVYVFGRYEVQVLDSFGDLPADNLCGGIYKRATPVVCASLPPLQWQTYDITFRAPRFDANGAKKEDAVITVVHNGTVIHDAVSLDDLTPGGISGVESATGPLLLQDHGDNVRYRNIWFKAAD